MSKELTALGARELAERVAAEGVKAASVEEQQALSDHYYKRHGGAGDLVGGRDLPWSKVAERILAATGAIQVVQEFAARCGIGYRDIADVGIGTEFRSFRIEGYLAGWVWVTHSYGGSAVKLTAPTPELIAQVIDEWGAPGATEKWGWAPAP